MQGIRRREFLQASATGLVVLSRPSRLFAQDRKLRIAFANYDNEASFGALVLRGMQKALAASQNVEALFYDNKKDGARVLEIARTVVTVKPDVFVEYNSIVPQANIQVARLMKEAGIPVLSIQVRVPDTPLFAVDNALSGYAAGKAIALTAQKKWPGTEPVVLLISLPESGAMFAERAANAKKGILEVFPDAIIEEHSSKEQAAVARQVTSDFLIKNQGRKVVIWTHVDAMGLAALTAARNLNRDADVAVGATGGDPAVFPEIRRANSPYVGTFSFFPELWGEDVLALASKIARRESIPDIVRPSRQLFVDATNIDQYYPQG